ncbi:hypothetical protein Nepgr_006007 [Nepenthes gracilis]|uniref:Uncharacterized protein n=1 Tax=Nepenthes gracilis TaxID=150966 RepID=A0AAD3XH05_NEPGR|nr:hypothetical protein Nepgr_006007 [Nepenthes gracilis]
MKKSAYVLILFFWALLAIINPTLVQWSTASESSSREHANGKKNGVVVKGRKMLVCFPPLYSRKSPQEELDRQKSPAVTPPAPAPAPSPLNSTKNFHPILQEGFSESDDDRVIETTYL